MQSHTIFAFLIGTLIVHTILAQNIFGPNQGGTPTPGVGPKIAPIPNLANQFNPIAAQNLGPIGPLSYGPGIGPINPLGAPLSSMVGPNSFGPSPLVGFNPGPINSLAGPVSYNQPIGYNQPMNNQYSNYGYGGSGAGMVGLEGELPVAGSTNVAGLVPMLGAVDFSGPVKATGTVTISGTCNSGYNNYGY